jgi:hypothetical protein
VGKNPHPFPINTNIIEFVLIKYGEKMNEKHKVVEQHLTKARTNLELAGKQATSRAESSLVEALHWLHEATNTMKAAYEEKITQLEAELQNARSTIVDTSVNSIVEDLKYFNSKTLTTLSVPAEYFPVEEAAASTEIVETVETVAKEELFPLEEIVASSSEEANQAFVEETQKLAEESINTNAPVVVLEQPKSPVTLKVAPSKPVLKTSVVKEPVKEKVVVTSVSPVKKVVKKK